MPILPNVCSTGQLKRALFLLGSMLFEDWLIWRFLDKTYSGHDSKNVFFNTVLPGQSPDQFVEISLADTFVGNDSEND